MQVWVIELKEQLCQFAASRVTRVHEFILNLMSYETYRRDGSKVT